MAELTGYDYQEFFSATPLATFTPAGARTAAAAATYACQVQDVTVGRDRDVIEWKTKCGANSRAGTVKKTLSVTMAVDYSSAVWAILTTAFDDNDIIFFASLSPDATGDGVAANVQVASLGEARPLEGVVTTTITLTVPDLDEFVEVI